MKKISIALLVLVGVLVFSKVNAASNKVLICHSTQSEGNSLVLIDVSDSALQAHLDHGDKVFVEGEGCTGGGPLPE